MKFEASGVTIVTSRRSVAARWDPALPPQEAAAIAGAPAGWSIDGNQAISPERLAPEQQS